MKKAEQGVEQQPAISLSVAVSFALLSRRCAHSDVSQRMIRFRYNPAFVDYAAFNRHVVWRSLRLPAIFGGLGFVAYCLQPLALLVLRGQQGLPYDSHLGLTPLIVPILVVLFLVFMRSSMRKTWDKSVELRSEREYKIDETGVRVEGSSFSGFLEWQAFESAECAGGYFFLKSNQNQYHYFPESVVPEAQVLRELLNKKIPKRKKG